MGQRPPPSWLKKKETKRKREKNQSHMIIMGVYEYKYTVCVEGKERSLEVRKCYGFAPICALLCERKCETKSVLK